MKSKLITISIILLAAAGVRAQMNLNDCLLYAREHAHDNILNRLEIEKAGVDRGIAASDLMPYVGLSSSGSISFGRNIDPETNTYDNKKTLYTGFGLQMSLPVFDGFANINNLKAAGVAKLRKISFAQAEEDLRSIEVIKAFYNVSYCKALVVQMEEQLRRDTNILAATLRGEELGIKSGADVLEIEAIVSSDEYELTNQRNLLSKAYLALRTVMGMETDGGEMELTEEPYETSGAEGNMINPRIEEAQLAVSESRYRLRAARGAFAPRISLNAGVSTSYFRMLGTPYPVPSFAAQWRDNMGQYVGFSVSIPVFTGLASVKRLRRAAIDYAEEQVRREKTVFAVEQANAEAILEYDSADREFVAAGKQLQSEELAFKAVSRKFELGSASALDFYTASTRLATARAVIEGKRIQRIISRITLDYYRGYPLIR